MKKITVNTFTPVYDPTEDRIRLALNYQDAYDRADLMITRSFILKLLGAMEEFMLKHYGSGAEPYEKQPPAQEQKGVSKTDGTNFELYKRDEELLLEVNFSYSPSTKDSTITFSSSGIQAAATLNEAMLKKFYEVLRGSIPFMSWGISPDF